jgi:hypothetical protein
MVKIGDEDATTSRWSGIKEELKCTRDGYKNVE